MDLLIILKLGPTHQELNAKKLMSMFKNIKSFFPKDSNETEKAVIQLSKKKKDQLLLVSRVIRRSEKNGKL